MLPDGRHVPRVALLAAGAGRPAPHPGLIRDTPREQATLAQRKRLVVDAQVCRARNLRKRAAHLDVRLRAPIVALHRLERALRREGWLCV